jgi:hypothetical protein
MKCRCSLACVLAGHHCEPVTVSSYYAPFLKFLSQARRSGKEFDLTEKDLKDIWERQRGICPYTGIPMLLPKNSATKLPKTPDRASLDRIDSKKGYTKDNVQFCSLFAQYAKNEWSDQVFRNFLAEINFTGKKIGVESL